MKYNEIPTEVYAIRDNGTGEVIWNSRGGCYTTYEGVCGRIEYLKELYPKRLYSIITWRHDDGCDWTGYIK